MITIKKCTLSVKFDEDLKSYKRAFTFSENEEVVETENRYYPVNKTEYLKARQTQFISKKLVYTGENKDEIANCINCLEDECFYFLTFRIIFRSDLISEDELKKQVIEFVAKELQTKLSEHQEKCNSLNKCISYLLDEEKPDGILIQENKNRQLAAKLLANSIYIGEDYYKLEDYYTAVLDGGNPERPSLLSPYHYAMINEINDAIDRVSFEEKFKSAILSEEEYDFIEENVSGVDDTSTIDSYVFDFLEKLNSVKED